MKDLVNVKIKFREPFRPFAPSVLAERAEEYFVLPEAAKHYPARFMLYVTGVKEEKREILPAITHVDGTGRLQTVRKDVSPRYYRLIEAFGQATGVPVVLNTSFNLKGEPIVNTPAEAFHTFTESGMDVLVLGEFVIDKSLQSGQAW
jgi:carbamoyltransferase